MVISDKYKFLLLSNPKCFSTSARKALWNYGTGYWTPRDGIHPHMTAREARHLFEQTGRDWSAYFKFTMARDPLERLVSYFEWGKCTTHSRYYWMPGWSEEHPRMTFSRWFWKGKVFDRDTREWTVSKRSFSVFEFAAIDGKLAVDAIYTEATLSEFEATMSQRLGAKIELPHMNRTGNERPPATSYFDAAMLEQVAVDFSYEYSALGYTLPVAPFSPAGPAEERNPDSRNHLS